MQIQHKQFVVTGAGSGIGRALTLALLRKGAKVAAADLRLESLQETQHLAGELSSQLTLHVANIAELSAVEQLAKEVKEQHGSIDGVINNAGIIQPFVKVVDLEYADINRVMQVNFFGTLYMTKTFLPELLSRPESYLVNVSSMGGFLPVPGQSVYGASKAAVKLLTEGLYAELKDTSVHVSVVFPGATATNITKNSGVTGPKLASDSSTAKAIPMLSADAAAALIIKGMERNATRIYLGKDSNFLNKLYRLSPNFATNFIAKKMQGLLNN